METDKKTIIIQKNQDGEYRIPSPDFTEAGACYTDNKQEAVDTAKAIHGADIAYQIKRVQEFKEERLYILSRHWPHPQPHGQTFYVSNLPGTGGNHNSDWGYVTESSKALPVSEINKNKFEKYMESMGEKCTAIPLNEKQSSIDNLLKRKKVQGVTL
jgi:hypothetical protein